jgi:hypothetical protein
MAKEQVMTPETLEGLLIDRSLGQLSPEVERLLEAYLVHDVEARRMGMGIEETIGLAKRTMPPTVASAPKGAWEQVERRRRGRVVSRSARWIAAMSGMAACLLGGFWLGHAQPGEGMGTARSGATGEGGQVRVLAASPVPAGAPAVAEFWSRGRIQALAMQQGEVRREPAGRLPVRSFFESPGESR